MAKYDETLILGYVEGELPAEDRAKVEALLATDPQLSALVVGMVQDCVGLRALPKEVPPSDLVEDVLGRVERGMLLGDPTEPMLAEPPAARRFRMSRIFAYSGLAAMLLISGGLLTLSLTSGGLLEQAQNYADVGNFFETGGKIANAERDGETERLASATGPVRENAELRMMAATPAPAPSASAAGGTVADAAKPEAMPEMARSVEEMALAAAQDVRPRSDFRFQRHTPPLVVRTQKQKILPADRQVAQGRVAGAPVQGLRVKVLTADLARAQRDVLQWASTNAAEVVEEDVLQLPNAPAAGSDAPAASTYGQAGDAAGQKVVMVRIEPRRTLDFVQYLNKDGQEAGLVPLDTVVRRSLDGERRGQPDDGYTRMGRQVAAAQKAPQEAADRVTARLAQLERNVRERQAGPAETDAPAVAMQPLALAMDQADTPSASAPVEQVERHELERITLNDAPAGRELPRAGVATNDWELLFQYELPNPAAPGEGLATLDEDAQALTVPVIISWAKP